MTFDQAMNAPERNLSARATITCLDSYVINVSPEQVISFTIDEGGDVPLGTVWAARYSLNVANADGEFLRGGSVIGYHTLNGARVQLEIGCYHDGAMDWRPCGVFYVDSTSAQEFSASMTIKGFDPMTKLDVVYQDELAYRGTTTLNDILNHIRSKGFTINGSLACNAGAVVSRAPDWGEDATAREALGYVLQLGGSYARCNRSGVIEIKPTMAAGARPITVDTYVDLTDDERFFAFDRIKARPAGSKKNDDYIQASLTGAQESAANTLVVDHNPLLRTTSTRIYTKTSDTSIKNKTYYVRVGGKYTAVPKGEEEPASLHMYYTMRLQYNTTVLQGIVNNLKNALSGLAIRAIQATWLGNPSLYAGDRITLTDTRGVSVATTVVQQTLRFDGGFRSEITCPIDLRALTPSLITSSGHVAAPSFGAGTINGSAIALHSIEAAQIAAGAISATEIASKTITADEIKAKSITSDEIAAKTITANEIAAKAIKADSGIIDDAAIKTAHIQTAAVKSANIDEAAIDTAHIKNGSITYAKMAEAAVGTLEADFLDAVRAEIDYISANQLTADELYVSLANIAKAQIKYANFDEALVGLLSADALDAVRADINTIVSNNLTSDQLYVNLAAIAVAQLTTANIQNASISWASINTLAAVIASIADTQIGAAQIDYAKIVDLVTETAIITEGVGGELYISRLAVTDANMVSLTVGDLMLKASDGSFVRLTVDELGDVVGVPVLVEGDNIDEATISGDHLIAETITARELNVSQIMASSAMVGAIKAANIDVANLFAATATISQLDSYIVSANTIEALQGELSVWADDKISVAVGDLDDRLTMAEETITPEAIVSTVVGSEAYQEALDRKADAEDLDGLATMAEVQQINQTTIAQTANNTTLSVRQERERAQAVEGEIRAFTDTAQTYFEFTLDGLYIGKYGSPFRTLAGNEKYSFLQDGVEVAYIQYNRLYIKAAHILDVLTIGNPIDGFTDITAESGGITAEWRDS